MTATTWWWLLTGGLVVLELLSGTFYLLMLGLGAAAGALATWAGAERPVQLLAAALVGSTAVLLWHRRQRRLASRLLPSENRDLNLDVGEELHVAHWGQDGRAQVHYRGANWQAQYRGPGPAAPGPHVIVAVESNHLVLAPRAHA
jgi:membrane protein implicated in regulation of membrane protease activity